MKNLTLFIPGLFLSRNDMVAVDSPKLPSLQKLLGHARCEALAPFSFCDMLSRLFNIDNHFTGDFPAASVTRLIDDEHSAEGIWMRADPVHLVADQARVILMDDAATSLDQHDALVLAADIQQLFTAHGMILEAPTIHRWYVKLPELPAVLTTPVHEVAGKDIDRHMPAGRDSRFWIRLMNEVQMVMHGNTVNQRREATHEKSVNSVWFWGGGCLPARSAVTWSHVYTDEDISCGLASLSGVACSELPDTPEGIIDQAGTEDEILVVLSFGMRHRQYHDINGWLDFLAYLDEFWFPALENAVRSGAVERLRLITEYQQFELKKMSFLKFWRRNYPVTTYAY